MARRENELFIGTEYLNIEGRQIKHPALIKLYATVNAKKTSDKPLELIGLDLETEANKGDLKLLGTWNGQKYQYYTSDFINVLFKLVKSAKRKKASLAYWNRLDPFVILKEFLRNVSEQEKDHALKRFGKISGEWNRKELTWDIHPVISLDLGNYEFGIIQAIRSSIQFYWKSKDYDTLHKVWAFDIAQLYQKGLEAEATSRLNYYSKVDKSAHIVDWKRFESDQDFRDNIVLLSNELDARACYDLGYIIQQDFYNAFKFYPRTLISQGSLARSAIVSQLFNSYEQLDEKQKNYAVASEIKSIGIMNYYDSWTKQYGQDVMKDMYALFTESYSGGYIEAIRYGYASEGYYTDIASAYPGVIQNLYDLRNAKITHGTGTPPNIANSYCFIRGVVNIPDHINFHPITIKHFIHKETNIRAVGTYRASYTLNERKFLLELGATFEDEQWYNIETTGEKSSLAKVCMNFIDLRKKFLAEGNSSQYMAKIAANSLYGILFEAVDTYTEQEIKVSKNDKLYAYALDNYLKGINLDPIKTQIQYEYGSTQKYYARWHNSDGIHLDVLKEELENYGIFMDAETEMDIFNEILKLYEVKAVDDTTIIGILKAGYRAGEFWNPLYASIITSETRITMAKAANAIEKNNGKVILMMTDSLFWTGKPDMIPSDLVKEQKTLGYFEKVEMVNDIVCLGSGRYGYKAKDGFYVAKKRGLNSAVIHDPNGIDLTDFDWHQALKLMARNNTDQLEMKTRTLISPGLVLHDRRYTWHDLGRVINDTRTIDAIVGKNKRFYEDVLKNPKILSKKLVNTHPIRLLPYMLGNGIVDQTLPKLREEMNKRDIVTRTEKKQKSTRKRVSKHYHKDDTIKDEKRRKYQLLKSYGYTRDECKRMSTWSMDRIREFLFSQGI
jgi:hypothetical protein